MNIRKISTFVVILTTAVFFCAPSGFSAERPTGENMQQGIWEYQHENYEEALEVFKKLRKERPDSSMAVYYLGMTYKQLQDYRKARPALEAAVAMKPRVDAALMELIDLLYKKGNTEEAKKWITVAEEENIQPAQTAFLKGLVLLREGKDTGGAIESFKKAESLDDSLRQSAEYYIGLTHIKAQHLAEAKDAFKIIASEYPGQSLASFASQYIDSIENKEYAERPFRGHVGFAMQYDSNVVLSPGDNILVTSIEDQADWRQVYTANAEYNYKPTDLFGVKAGYTLYVGKMLDLGFYDTVSHNIYAQPAFYLDKVVVNFPCKYNYVTINDKGYLSLFEISNMTNIMYGDNQMAQFAAAYKNEEFLWEPSGPGENRDSNEYMGHVGWFYFFAKGKAFANMSYTLNYDDTEEQNWRYLGNKFSLSSVVPLMDNLRAGVTLQYTFQTFVKENLIFHQKRRDNIFNASCFLTYEVIKNLELQLNYAFIDNGSNVTIYSYNRNIFSMGAKYKF